MESALAQYCKIKSHQTMMISPYLLISMKSIHQRRFVQLDSWDNTTIGNYKT